MDTSFKTILGLSPADYNTWKASGLSDTFPVWAVQQNKISPEKYRKWAINQYQIPFVKDSFFYNITINQSIWQKVHNKAPWNKDLVPLYEWDNTLFAGCIQPPPFELAPNIVAVLIMPKQINILWKKIQQFSNYKPLSSTPTAKARVTPTPTPIAKPISTPKPSLLNSQSKTESIAPDPLNKIATKPKEHLSPQQSPPPKQNTEQQAPLTLKSPIQQSTPPPKQNTAQQAPLTLKNPVQQSTPPPKQNPEQAPLTLKSSIQQSPPSPPEENDPESFTNTSLLDTVIKNETQTQIKQMAEDEICDQVLKKSKRFFIGSIIFSFQNKEFTPLEWTSSLKGHSIPIKTDKPSCFRIICMSKKSYHGFVVQNEQHKHFFKLWGFKAVPEHVTLIPVLNKEQNVIGAFMGIAEQDVSHKALYEVEKWAKQIALALPKPKQKSYKAS